MHRATVSDGDLDENPEEGACVDDALPFPLPATGSASCLSPRSQAEIRTPHNSGTAAIAATSPPRLQDAVASARSRALPTLPASNANQASTLPAQRVTSPTNPCSSSSSSLLRRLARRQHGHLAAPLTGALSSSAGAAPASVMQVSGSNVVFIAPVDLSDGDDDNGADPDDLAELALFSGNENRFVEYSGDQHTHSARRHQLHVLTAGVGAALSPERALVEAAARTHAHKKREIAESLTWQGGIPASTPACLKQALAESLLKASEVPPRDAPVPADTAQQERERVAMLARQRAAAAIFKQVPLKASDTRCAEVDALMRQTTPSTKPTGLCTAASINELCLPFVDHVTHPEARSTSGTSRLAQIFGGNSPMEVVPPTAEFFIPPCLQTATVVLDASAPVEPVASQCDGKSLLEQMGGIEAVLKRESAHRQEAEDRKDQQLDRVLDVLEAKQALADKLEKVTKVCWCVVACYTTLSRSRWTFSFAKLAVERADTC